MNSNAKALQVSCPEGMKLIGGSQRVLGHNQNVVAQGYPNASANRWDASASEDSDGQLDNWALYGYAICANVAE